MTDETSDMHFLDPQAPIDEHRHYLPHWDQGDVLYFVSYHLADAIPAHKLAGLVREREAWLAAHPKPWGPSTEAEYISLFSHRIDAWADAGHGTCVLGNPQTAAIVADAFHYFDEERYWLHDYVIMPNHVHIQFRLAPGQSLKNVMHSWRSYTATQINRIRNGRGALWQSDYWDRIIRDKYHYLNVKRYIANNPVKGHLANGTYRYWTTPPIPRDWW